MREFELLKHVRDTFTPGDPRVVLGPGDDMAALRLEGRDLLAAVDQVVAGRHFDPNATEPALIGRKAVARSLSDVAAMAARPVAALAAATLPPDFGEPRARELFDGMRDMAEVAGCPLVGGDVAFHASADLPLTCSVTVLAEPGPAGVVRRTGARAGDTIFVTGALGGSLGAPGQAGRHLTFTPRIAEALELAGALGDRLHAMIDVSDGAGRDAAHLATAVGLRIEIDADRVPCHAGVGWRQAVSDGEDYELLFAATGAVPETLAAGLAVTALGRVVAPSDDDPVPPHVVIRDGAETIDADALGWEHRSVRRAAT